MTRKITNNWKIEELLQSYPIEIIPVASQEYDINTVESLSLPRKRDNLLSSDRTLVEWNKVQDHHKFFIDHFSRDLIREQFKKSFLANYDNLIISFAWDESVAKIPSHLFLEDPLEFFMIQLYCGFVYSEDFTFLLEVTEDYYIHSNFEIFPDTGI